MTTASTLSAADLRRVLTSFAELLRSHREVINRLNVYPVPDGDTGTNMTLTVDSVVEALDPLGPDPAMDDLCQAVAHGSLMGARGNSGVILSQMLRGLTSRFRGAPRVSPEVLADALEEADESARRAVVRVVEGTMLSVARGAAAGARKECHELVALVRAARDAARVALARTPDQLDVLRQAGVVDSGGTGLVLFFDALCHVVADDPVPVAPPVSSIHVHVHEQPAAHADGDLASLRYEVMYLLEAEDSTMPAFREVWAGIGDSIVIVGGDGLFNCHIHTDDVGAAVQPVEPDLGPAPTTSVVAVVVGEGVGRIFRSLGVRTLVAGGQSMNPSTADLVAAVEATGSAEVVILPNNKNIRPVAEQVDALVAARVSVVPTTSIVEGFAALLAYDPDASAGENAAKMCESATHV